MPSPTTTKILTLTDFASKNKLASSLASAFSTDPFLLYPFGPSSSVPSDPAFRLTPVFHAMLEYALSKNAVVHYSADENAVAIWFHDDSYNDKRSMLGLHLAIQRCYHLNAPKFLEATDILADNHPKTPHFYLWLIGTHRNSRGEGLGGSVIRKTLEECDRRGVPAYLESSNRKNIPFYERHGFVVKQEIPGLPKDCPPLTAMWRDPKKPAEMKV